MLQRASAADAKMRATRRNAVGRCDHHIDQVCFIHLPAPLAYAKAHALRRQRALDEHRLALDARDTAAVVRKIDDIGFLNSACA